jgi:hypothetical protein
LPHRIDEFGAFQKSVAHIFNEQSTWLEWTPFNQKQRSVLWTSAFFSVSSLTTLLQPRGRGCRITHLVGFKNDLLAPTIKFNEFQMFERRLKPPSSPQSISVAGRF